MRRTLDRHEASTSAVVEVKESGGVDNVERSSLAAPRIAPLRGLLKLLVQADASRSKLSRLGAIVILLAALSVFALLGYLLPSLLL